MIDSKGQQTQQAILAAARQLILAQGFTATSMRQIAKEANITPAAIYNHFDGKDALFTALLHQVAPIDEIAVLLSRRSGETVEQVVTELIRGLMELMHAHQDYIRLALIDTQERNGAAVASLIPRVSTLSTAFLLQMIQRDVAAGRMRDLPPLLLIRMVISLVGGFIFTEQAIHASGIPYPADFDWQNGLTDILLHGILQPTRDERNER